MTDDEWARYAPLLEPALDGCHALDDVRAEIDADRAELWPLSGAAVVTQVLQHPRKRVLRVWLAGGDLDAIRRAAPALDRIARELRCSRIEVDGRKGWTRILEGYDVQRVTLTRDL